jgi:hypothetical protein
MLIALFVVTARTQAPATPAFSSKSLVDNDKVRVQRLDRSRGFPAKDAGRIRTIRSRYK